MSKFNFKMPSTRPTPKVSSARMPVAVATILMWLYIQEPELISVVKKQD